MTRGVSAHCPYCGHWIDKRSQTCLQHAYLPAVDPGWDRFLLSRKHFVPLPAPEKAAA